MRAGPSWLLSLVCLLGCFPGPTLPEGFGVCEASSDPQPESPIEQPSYHRDIRPILDASCNGCHVDGGIGPFSLTDYAAAKSFGPLMLAAVDAGAMPPWPPSTCCAPLLHERMLRARDRAVLERWLELDAPEGDPADAPPPSEPAGLSRVDLEITMPEPYTPSATIGDYDDQRCFLIDWPLGGETFVTGLEVVPGRRELVHHAIVYAIPESQVPIYEALDDNSSGPGWSCPGGVLQSADAYVGSWVPGAGVHDFPDGLGRRVRANTKVLLNVHYELSAGPAPDQTSVRFRLDDSVATEVEGLAVMNPAWLVGKTMRIPAGESDVVHGYAYDPATWFNLGQSLQVHNVSLHMHEFGARASLAVLRANGDVDCLLHIDDWDFDWQGEYWLASPVMLRFGDRLYVECHFDNSTSNQPDGGAPRDLWWGDDQEMCVGSVLVSR
ncbi:MAG TPA: hypothetical protein VK034_00480 [Enhygromyxa sp.]|nr:hypothetical protein [Enhygromyxa sp.]